MKIQKISEIQPSLPITEFDFLQKYRASFDKSELGYIHAKLPLKEMADKIASHFPRKKPQGNKPMFPPEGEVALMFLKSYTGLSDDWLVEMLNGNIHMQMFCGVLINPEWNTLCRQFAPLISLTAEQSKRLDALKKVRRQQLNLMNKKEVRGRIVSIDRPYLRPIVRGKGLSQMQRMQISALPDASSAICEPQLWRAASAIINYTSGLVLSPLETAAARHCSSSSTYTWPTPQYLPPDNLPVKKKLERKKSGPD